MPDYPQEGALRGGHIPARASVPWARAAADDATFRTRAELEAIYQERAGPRAGRRRRRLLPHRRALQPHLVRADPPARLRAEVRNYDGSLDRVGQLRARADRAGTSPERRRPDDASACRRPPQLAELVADFAEVEARRTSCSCCSSSPTSCPRCPTATRTRGVDGAGARVPVAAVPARRGRPAGDRPGAPVLLRARRGARPPAGSRRSWPRPGRAAGRRHPGGARTTSTPTSVWPALISPLRLRGMSAMLARIKRQVRARVA